MRESGEPCNTGRSRSSSPASIDASRTTIVQIYNVIVDRNKSALVYVNGGGRRRGRSGVSFALSMSIDNVLAVCRISFHVFKQRLTWEISGNTSRRIPIVRLLLRASLSSASISINRLSAWKKFSLLCCPCKPFSHPRTITTLDFFLFHSREIVEYRGGVSLVSKKTGGRDGITQRVAQRTTERHKFSCAVVIVSLLQSNFRHRTGNEMGTRAGRFYGRSEV